jgi:predicted ABC-type transport system involved in lysophospholipase L1 biosynthesis ATPase subunit
MTLTRTTILGKALSLAVLAGLIVAALWFWPRPLHVSTAEVAVRELNPFRGKAVMELLGNLGRSSHAAVIVVTHDERMIEGFDRVYHMIDGRITNH